MCSATLARLSVTSMGSRRRTGRIARFVARMGNGEDRTSGLVDKW
jgi:hypothetical protein